MSILKHFFRFGYENYSRRTTYGRHRNPYPDHRRYRYSRPALPLIIFSLLGRFLPGGKRLLWVLGGIGMFMLILTAGILAVLIPFMYQAIEYVGQYGIRGAIELATGLLLRIWEGSGG